MLQKYPQIKSLYGPCGRTKYICTLLVAVQFGTAYLLRDAPWWQIVLVAYAFGGVINHALLLAIHELSHNLGFRSPLHNRLFALFINLPVGIPVAATFRYYHLLHHAHQGDDGVDTDLPSEQEARVVRGPLRKFAWLALQGFAYGLRPLFVHPKRPDRWEIANFLLQVAFDGALLYLCGAKALAYLPISSLIVMGLHPVAGHYISEHYVFGAQAAPAAANPLAPGQPAADPTASVQATAGATAPVQATAGAIAPVQPGAGSIAPVQETYSYYGPLNKLTFNVGYHNEHHDFPYVPGSRLARLRAIAPDYYDGLMHHSSWALTLWRYVTEPELGPYRRVKRPTTRQKPASSETSAVQVRFGNAPVQ